MAKKALTKMKRTEAMAELSCEWTDCNQVFYDLTLYLQHIHKSHINEYNPGFDDETDRSYSCQWIGCEENRFDNYSQFCLHVSYHGFHQKLMSNGLAIMKTLGLLSFIETCLMILLFRRFD